MVFNNLLIEKCDAGITTIKINRPAALNALNNQTLAELKAALGAEAKNDATRVVVLTGEGEKAFIAGADISEMKDMTSDQAVAFAKAGHEVTILLEQMPKVTIAAVNGYALGGGMEMALACDFIFAGDKAVFGQPEVSLGIIPGFGGTVRLLKYVGVPRAKELIFSGRKIKADEALIIGIANQVFAGSEMMQKVLEIARAISAQSLDAIIAAKRLLNEFSEMSGLNLKLDEEARTFGKLFELSDQREGMSAFVERRKPKFAGL